MGLDITAFSKLKKIDATFDADGEPIDHETREPLDWHLFRRMDVNDHFPGRAGSIEDKAVYQIEGEEFGFRAGSYGGYGEWRRWLARLAGYATEDAWEGKANDKPFAELVNFSDYEGVIGPEVSAKLAKDFAEFDDRAKANDTAPFFYERYQMWRKAFELAADSGAVDFH